MAAPVLVRHPDKEDLVYEVEAGKVEEWLEAGWKRVKRADEGEVRASLDKPTK